MIKIEVIEYKDEEGKIHSYKVGENDVQEIIQHEPRGEGDKWSWDVKFSNGKYTKLFEVNRVHFINTDEHIPF